MARTPGKSSQNVRVRRATPEPLDRKDNLRKSVPLLKADPKPPQVIGTADPILSAAVIALIAFGIVMVYSASQVYAQMKYSNDHALLVKQALHAALAVPLMFVLSSIDYHRLRALTYPLLLGSLALLLTTVLGFGHSAGGAARWLHLGSFGVQPSEIAKLAVICWLAYSLSRKTASIHTFSVGFLPHVLGAGAFMALCLRQPDFGSAMMIGLILVVMLFTAGAQILYLLGAVLAAAPIVYFLVKDSPYRLQRVLSFWLGTENYQMKESWMSFGLGGIRGVGLGESTQKLMFLPEAHTDFISAIVGEELGLIGFGVMVSLFLLVVYRGIVAAFAACDEYGTYLAVGISLFLGTQAFTNLAVAVGIVPTKGLVLPFISYGGSSLVVNCCCMGILLNVSRARSSVSFQAPTRANASSRAIGGVA